MGDQENEQGKGWRNAEDKGRGREIGKRYGNRKRKQEERGNI